MSVVDLATGYRALRDSAGAVQIERDVLLAIGGDAVSFLHGQLSQDIEALANGQSAWSFVLQPDGKVVALVRVTRLGEGAVALDVEAGQGEAVKARLARFLLRVDCRIDGPIDNLTGVAVRGPASSGVDIWNRDQLLKAPAGWAGIEGFDLIAGELGVDDAVPEVPAEALEAVRIEAGWPATGRDLTDASIPAEAGADVVNAAVSFTKGCYAGQELVERMDSRGSQAPRPLRGVVLTGEEVPPVGAEVVHQGETVGHITSAAFSPGLAAAVAFAAVARKVEVPAAVQVRWDGHEADAEIRPFPLV